MTNYYRVTARVMNRPNGVYTYRTEIPTFYLADVDQMITSAADAAAIAWRMIADTVRQDMSAGARVHGEVYCATTDDYAPILAPSETLE